MRKMQADSLAELLRMAGKLDLARQAKSSLVPVPAVT
jgi:hypothetical protein